MLHGVPGVAADVLAKFVAPGARFAPHYYVDSNGAIFQLIDEQYAAWHAGFATLDKVWFNINRSSVGIALERPALWPEAIAAYPDAQTFALRWLLQQLDRRYQLAPDAVVLWSSLAGNDRQTLDGLPLESIAEVLAYR
ncbi:N-acetylmuramoyl-L-alanine amidase [Candidatus Gracilibacteria bacterium]|nr:N-acetylmuramoyl-L-alanine amidase [Candidatus Gracilibacteria bacterium]